jgi:RNA polymerase sigma factor (sigma-70 family)
LTGVEALSGVGALVEDSSGGMTTVMSTSQNGVASRTRVRDEPHVKGALSKSMNGWLQHHMKEWPKVWTACVRRTHRWRVPPRWSLSDWWEEIDAESIAAACHAIRIFDPNLGPTLNSFVYHTILASALSRYRKEWTYALRYGMAQSEDSSTVAGAEDRFSIEQEEELLKRTLTNLPEADRRLLQRLFWEGRTETEIASGLGITQQAVSKRKRKILSELRRCLNATDEDQEAKKHGKQL